MAAAEVGDDVFGEDPTVNALEEEVADLLGHEAGIFTPTGSMANQLGLRLHVAPGRRWCATRWPTSSAPSWVRPRCSPASRRGPGSPRGLLSAADPLSLMITGAGAYQVNTALVVVENTHNFGGGTVQSIDEIRLLRKDAQDAGADPPRRRAALERPRGVRGGAGRLRARVRHGLGMPQQGPRGAGGLGAGRVRGRDGRGADLAEAVRRGMRQVGILAAAGRYAVAHHMDRLADDHARARRAARRSRRRPGCLDPALVETNILVMDVSGAGWTGADFAAAALAEGSGSTPSGRARSGWSGISTFRPGDRRGDRRRDEAAAVRTVVRLARRGALGATSTRCGLDAARHLLGGRPEGRLPGRRAFLRVLQEPSTGRRGPRHR